MPREDIAMRDCTPAELEELTQSAAEFSREKAAFKVNTPYGMPYSPHYLRQSRAAKKT